MPLITASHDSLPCTFPTLFPPPSHPKTDDNKQTDIDPPTPPAGPHSLPHATALIASTLPSFPASPSTLPPHPALPPLQPSTLSELTEKEQERVKNKTPLEAIDLSRYEAPSSSSGTVGGGGGTNEDDKERERERLRAAYVSVEYLRQRGQHLSLLEEFGKNAWIVGNARLEDILRGVEGELVGAREEVEGVNRERKAGQERGRREMEGLERSWKEGVGRGVEVEVAVGMVETEVRERLRERSQK
ncbi:MAG: hypothetical protein LQ342_002105 [Letrouitia transgressa]|nr:MAG: hypothetical protein LQ342_002105 [Letrouitia transgressa]